MSLAFLHIIQVSRGGVAGKLQASMSFCWPRRGASTASVGFCPIWLHCVTV